MSNTKDGLYGIVTGTVEKVGTYTGGTYARIAYQSNPNNKYPDRVTAWGVESPVSEGQRVKVSGQLSTRKNERDGKVYVDVSLNFPKVEVLEASAPGADSWNTPSTFDGTEPF